MTQYFLRGEYHVLLEIYSLPDLTVYFGNDLERCTIGKELRTDQRWTDRGKLVKGLGEKELASLVLCKLEHAARQIVTDGVA